MKHVDESGKAKHSKVVSSVRLVEHANEARYFVAARIRNQLANTTGSLHPSPALRSLDKNQGRCHRST